MPSSMPSRTWLPSKGSLDFGLSARKIKMSPVKNTGRFATQKSLLSQDFESLLEQDFMTLLEYDNRVESFVAQPITLQWIDVDGKQRSYTPDTVVKYKPWLTAKDSSLVTTLYEVKPRKVLMLNWSEFKPRFKGAVAWAKLMGYRFRIVTEREIQTPYLENVRFLLRFRSDLPNDEVTQRQQLLVLETIRRVGSTTPKKLLSEISTISDRQAEFLPWIWYLINRNVIGCDLSMPLGMNTIIWPVIVEGAT